MKVKKQDGNIFQFDEIIRLTVGNKKILYNLENGKLC